MRFVIGVTKQLLVFVTKTAYSPPNQSKMEFIPYRLNDSTAKLVPHYVRYGREGPEL